MRPKILIERLALCGLVFAFLNISGGLAARSNLATANIQAIARVVTSTGITDIDEEDMFTRQTCSEIIGAAGNSAAPDEGYFLLYAASLDGILMSVQQADETTTVKRPDQVLSSDNTIIEGPGRETLLICKSGIEAAFECDSGDIAITVIRCDN